MAVFWCSLSFLPLAEAFSFWQNYSTHHLLPGSKSREKELFCFHRWSTKVALESARVVEGLENGPARSMERRKELEEIFGEAGTHARAAIGVAELPLGAPVELELIVEVQS